MHEVMLRCAIACHAWPAALSAARHLTATYQLLYPAVSPPPAGKGALFCFGVCVCGGVGGGGGGGEFVFQPCHPEGL